MRSEKDIRRMLRLQEAFVRGIEADCGATPGEAMAIRHAHTVLLWVLGEAPDPADFALGKVEELEAEVAKLEAINGGRL